MENVFADTIKSIEETIERQRLIYESLLSKAETDEQKESIQRLMALSNSINEAINKKDITALNKLLTELSDANNTNK
ncbi:hypothetical protein [Flavobacterium sp.]|jgi:hypothetical protein|uniref:hypothetical protein n=1 Tax=Flavobacterium sp. TaxID=239 RepID=UPI003341CE12